MTSYKRLVERMLIRGNKKGQVIDLTSNTVISVMVLVFVVVAVLFGIAALDPSTFFTTGTPEANATKSLTGNLTKGVGVDFAGKLPTVFLVLGVVLALSAIAVLIMYVRRMGAGGTGSSL